jgi:predicted transcriptional regulator with HTH domain
VPLLEHTVWGMYEQETKAEGLSSNALYYLYCIYRMTSYMCESDRTIEMRNNSPNESAETMESRDNRP